MWQPALIAAVAATFALFLACGWPRRVTHRYELLVAAPSQTVWDNYFVHVSKKDYRPGTRIIDAIIVSEQPLTVRVRLQYDISTTPDEYLLIYDLYEPYTRYRLRRDNSAFVEEGEFSAEAGGTRLRIAVTGPMNGFLLPLLARRRVERNQQALKDLCEGRATAAPRGPLPRAHRWEPVLLFAVVGSFFLPLPWPGSSRCAPPGRASGSSICCGSWCSPAACSGYHWTRPQMGARIDPSAPPYYNSAQSLLQDRPHMQGQPLRIGVIGAGIGGLTAALSLRRAGFEVDIYEQAPALTHIGGGINMGPNAARILIRLGLGEGLLRDGVCPSSTHQRRWDDGRTLQRSPLNPQCEELYGAPHFTIHRADLLAVISSGMPAERIHLDHRLVGFADKGDHVEAWFDNGERITPNILVGADGIHSAVRATLFGEEAPRFAGCVAYRGLVPVERLADLDLELGSQSWVGPGAHLVHYFVSRGELLNFVGWTEHDEWNREDWTDRATVARALAAFEGWHPQIRRIIGAADECFIWALFDRDPLSRWSAGRVTLLGDSCHPMYPFMGQGAAQAIEDGAALAACLAADAEHPADALQHYERLRLPRVTRLQEMSRANKLRFHMRDGPGQQARDAEWARVGDRSPDALRWLYDFDPAALETAPV